MPQARSANIARPLPGRRFDHVFFPCMALLILATVFVGFARTYYLAGLFQAPLPSPVIHLHGAAFSCWILLLVAQTSLVSARRLDIHRRLGIAGFLLACVMVVLGVWAGTDSLVRSRAAGAGARFFYIVALSDMLIFATLVALAFRERLNPPAHKRLILVATTALIVAAVARWPFALVLGNAFVSALFTYFFLILLASYDLWSMRKVHPATIWASVFLIGVQWIRVPIGRTAAWHAFAGWVQAMAR